jgi:glycosyltransferase involved in cell wall biosynthesis
MKAGVYCSTFRYRGGGEKYLLSVAQALAGSGAVVEVCTEDAIAIAELRGRYNLDLRGVALRRIEPHRFAAKPLLIGWFPPYRVYNHLREDGRIAAFSREYDLFVNICTAIPMKCRAARGALIIQFPFPEPQRPFDWRSHLASYGVKLCYSQFAREWIDARWGVEATIVQPPVEQFEPLEKQNIILNVGRFFVEGHNKKQPVLIEAFRQLVHNGLLGWELHLAGSNNDPVYLDRLRSQALGLPVMFHPDLPHHDLGALYGRAKLYWHATGFGEDARQHPERMEHFGMTTLEAMSAGAVPLVYNGGGQAEIIRDGDNGVIWNDPGELSEKTMSLLADQRLRRSMAESARRSARGYDMTAFQSAVRRTLELR